MTGAKGDQDAKDEIKKGMDQAGKAATPKTGKRAGTDASGSDEVSRGMAEAGSGATAGAGAAPDKTPKQR